MSKENAENTPSSNHMDDEDESSDSDDLDERPTEVFRKVLSENLISPINTPTRGLPSVSGKSPSPKKSNAALPGHRRQSTTSSGEDQASNAASCHKRLSTHSSSADPATNAASGGQSTFSSGADQTYADSQTVESTLEQIGDGSTSDVIDPSTVIDSRTLKTCNSEKDASTKGTKVFDTSEPPAYTAVEIIVQSNTSNPMKDSPLVYLSSTGHGEEVSSSPAQNDQLGEFVADVLLSGSSSRQSEDSLGTCSAEENASTERTNIMETSEPSAYTAFKVIVPSNTSDPKDPPLVLGSSAGYEEEISSSREQNDQLGDFAADVLLSDSSSKQAPSSRESENSDDIEMYEISSSPAQSDQLADFVSDVPLSGSSSRQYEDSLGACNAEEYASTKRMKIVEISDPSAYTGVKVIVPSNTSDPKDSPLVFVSSTGYEEEISSSPEQNEQLGDFAADVLMSDSSSKQAPSSGESENSDDIEMYEVSSSPAQSDQLVDFLPDVPLSGSSSRQSEDSLGACNAEEYASTKRMKIVEISDPSAYTGVKVIVPSNTSDPKDPPLVFVSSTGYEEEISSSPEQNEQLGDFAADVLQSDNSSKQVPSSGESEDSDDVGTYEFPSQPSQRFTTPEALEEEIRSVFRMISSYVVKEINKIRTKRETLQLNLNRRRAFVRYPLSQTLGQFSAVSQRIASELLSTLTEHEGLEFTYQGLPRINDQLAFRCLIQESAQYFGHESYGILSRGSYGACLQQSSESQEPTEESSQAFSGRSGQASFTLGPSSSRGLAPSPSSGLAPSSSRRLAPSPFRELAPSHSRGLAPSPSEGMTSASGGLAEASSRMVANPDRVIGPELSELSRISRLFSRGYFIGLAIGSERYAQRYSGRALQSRFGQMIQDLQQPPEVQTQGIQELFDLASRMIFLISPRITHWLNTSVPRNIAQTYFAGLFVGFSQAYSQWSGRRQVFCLSSRSVPRLLHGLSSNLHRDLLLMTQRALQGSLNGPGFPHGSSMGFSNTPTARFSRGHSLRGPSARRPFRYSVTGHGFEPRSSSWSTRASDQERHANIQEGIHVLLTQLVLDLNMIRALADWISWEYRRSRTSPFRISPNFERISNYLLCFEIMREDYREKESRYAALEGEISNNVQRYRREAFAIVHVELLIDILEHCISRVQYGALLIRTHERLGEVRTISNAIRRVTRTAMSYLMWTKED